MLYLFSHTMCDSVEIKSIFAESNTIKSVNILFSSFLIFYLPLFILLTFVKESQFVRWNAQPHRSWDFPASKQDTHTNTVSCFRSNFSVFLKPIIVTQERTAKSKTLWLVRFKSYSIPNDKLNCITQVSTSFWTIRKVPKITFLKL